jgi:hypothetical protein
MDRRKSSAMAVCRPARLDRRTMVREWIGPSYPSYRPHFPHRSRMAALVRIIRTTPSGIVNNRDQLCSVSRGDSPKPTRGYLAILLVQFDADGSKAKASRCLKCRSATDETMFAGLRGVQASAATVFIGCVTRSAHILQCGVPRQGPFRNWQGIRTSGRQSDTCT